MRVRTTRPQPTRLTWRAAAAVCLGVALVWVLGARAQGPDTPRAGDASTGASASGTTQPIAFSHAEHVSQVGLDCQFCHAYARRGPVAGIPSVQRCVGCHRVVLNDQPEILKLIAYWEDEAPIPWVRVHDLPDHVRFTHRPHVRAEVACADCHGRVDQMDAAVQVESLSMGWCVSCHRERQANLDCLACHY